MKVRFPKSKTRSFDSLRSLPMNKMLEKRVCKQKQQVSFRGAEIAGQQVSGSSSPP
jgi:hypothetical protein